MITKSLDEMTVRELLVEAEALLIDQATLGRPLVAAFRAPCRCGDPKCSMKFSITVTPYTELVHSTLREIQ